MDLRIITHVAAKRHTLTRRFPDNNLDIIVFTYVKSSRRLMTGGAQRVYLSDTHALMRVKRGKTLVLDNANGGVYGWVTNCTYPFRLSALPLFRSKRAVDRMATTYLNGMFPLLVIISLLIHHQSHTKTRIMEKVFAIYHNGNLFLHSLSAEEVRSFFDRMANKRSYDGGYRKVETVHGIFTTLEDEWVYEQYDSVNDNYGECYHRVVKDLDGNVLSDVTGGDWCATQPNAYGVTPERRSRASLYYAERDFLKTAAAAAALM